MASVLKTNMPNKYSAFFNGSTASQNMKAQALAWQCVRK